MIVAALAQEIFRFVIDDERDLVLGELESDAFRFKIDDLADLLLRQRMEDDRRVDPVEELRSEGLLQLAHHLLAHLIVFPLRQLVLVSTVTEAKGGITRDLLGADVRGHDDDRVAEIDLASLGVRQIAILHDLKEHVERFRVRLFDFIKQDH